MKGITYDLSTDNNKLTADLNILAN